MPKKELKAYFDWFLSQIAQRIAGLEREVRTTASLANWNADKSPESLSALGGWFVRHVQTRQRTPEEIREITAVSSIPISIPNQELTNRTFSLAMDVGMYLAETLRAQHPKLEWRQFLEDKKFVDYGQPVLVGFGAVPLNPVRIVITLAYGIADQKQGGERLRELYDYWSRQAAKF